MYIIGEVSPLMVIFSMNSYELIKKQIKALKKAKKASCSTDSQQSEEPTPTSDSSKPGLGVLPTVPLLMKAYPSTTTVNAFEFAKLQNSISYDDSSFSGDY